VNVTSTSTRTQNSVCVCVCVYVCVCTRQQPHLNAAQQQFVCQQQCWQDNTEGAKLLGHNFDSERLCSSFKAVRVLKTTTMQWLHVSWRHTPCDMVHDTHNSAHALHNTVVVQQGRQRTAGPGSLCQQMSNIYRWVATNRCKKRQHSAPRQPVKRAGSVETTKQSQLTRRPSSTQFPVLTPCTGGLTA
jgi:hypothetical protein